MRSYEAARSLFSILGSLSWAVIGVGGVAALIGAGSAMKYGGLGAGFLGMMPGISIAVYGFVLLAFVQIGRAVVDTAEYTQQMLKIARDQLEVSRQSLNHNSTSSTGFADQKSKPKSTHSDVGYSATKTNPESSAKPLQLKNQTPASWPKEPNNVLTQYKGKSIEEKRGKFICNGVPFDTMDKAKNYVDNFTSTPTKSLPGTKKT